MKTCLEGNCINIFYAKEKCQSHYRKRQRIINPDAYKSINRMHKMRFGGVRDFILKRDGYMCVSCGMTNSKHKLLFNRNLTINHIDKQGRNYIKPNNNINNLETLCLRCHSQKDSLKHGNYSNYLA